MFEFIFMYSSFCSVFPLFVTSCFRMATLYCTCNYFSAYIFRLSRLRKGGHFDMTSVRNFPLKTSGGPTKNWQTGVRHPDEKRFRLTSRENAHLWEKERERRKTDCVHPKLKQAFTLILQTKIYVQDLKS